MHADVSNEGCNKSTTASDFASAFHQNATSTDSNPQSSKDEALQGDMVEASPKGDCSSIPQEFFYIKEINCMNGRHRIVLQSVNGPCPLIAVINILVLRGEMKLEKSNYVTASELCSLLGNFILDKHNHSDKLDSEHREQYTVDSLDRFVQIQTGIDVNVRFNSPDGFEYTPELALFDFLSIKLLHGWLYDPQDKLLSDLVDDLSYNQLVEKALTLQGSENDSDVSNYLVIKDFIDTAQLTVHGLCEIIHVLNDGEVVALFRNNHFSTICKQNSRLYLLVTDIGWKEDGSVVWETLDSTTNCSSFVNGFFNPSEGEDSSLYAAGDIQITEEERQEQQKLWDEAKEQQQQQQQQQQHQYEQVQSAGRYQPNENPNRNPPRRKSSSSCVVM